MNVEKARNMQHYLFHNTFNKPSDNKLILDSNNVNYNIHKIIKLRTNIIYEPYNKFNNFTKVEVYYNLLI